MSAQFSNLNFVIRPGLDGWFVGKILEYPGVLSQGRTITETRENLMDALALFLDSESD